MSPLSRKIAQRNRRYLNKVMRHVVRLAPGQGLLTHTGRTSGRRYTIPVNYFVRQGRYLIALTYGERSDWVRNVMASRRASLRAGRADVELSDPRVLTDPGFTWAPWPVAFVLRRIDAPKVMVFDAAEPAPRTRSRRPLPGGGSGA